MNYKTIHIGKMIEQAVTEKRIEIFRIRNFLKCTEEEIQEMYKYESISTDILLKWSKLLEYDFFRIYTQHLILFAPPTTVSEKSASQQRKEIVLPQFRKNIYTKEVIDFMLEQITTGEMTRNQIIERYRIPKTTLYKWINKYGNLKN